MTRGLLKAFRKTHNLKQSELAELLGVAQSTVSNYESGNPMHIESYNRFRDLMDEHGINNEYILEGEFSLRGKHNKYENRVKTEQEELPIYEEEAFERPASDHYHTGKIDVWAFADENYSMKECLAFHGINAIKYIVRYGKKEGYNITDLEKAIVSIKKMIEITKEAKQ